METTLRDGTPVLLRPIRPGDKAELAAGLLQLSDLTVHRRFLSPKRHFSSTELRYLTEVDGHDHVAIVAEVPTLHPGRVMAVARWVRLAEDPFAAEAAIVVADPLQGQGLGSMLADRLAEAAAAHGVQRFTATMLSDNRAAHRLMERLADRLEESHVGSGAMWVSARLGAVA